MAIQTSLFGRSLAGNTKVNCNFELFAVVIGFVFIFIGIIVIKRTEELLMATKL